MSASPIALRPGWLWDCPACGLLNVEDPPPADVSESERIELGLPEGDLAYKPNNALCRGCLAMFPVEQPEPPPDEAP